MRVGIAATALEYASDLRQRGRADDAARIDDMAERYEQVKQERVRRQEEGRRRWA